LVTTLAAHKPRIFEKGQDSSGSKIGTYSTTPASISKKNQARQTGRTYFPGGYAQYKTAVGKNPGYVNLRNTDQMMMDYGIVQNGKTFGFGFQNEENANKSQWMQEKYDKDIFMLSDSELEVMADVLVSNLDKELAGVATVSR
jgi:hypothetical protein